MTMETAIQVLAIIQFTIVGLSHALQPRAWVEFFNRVHDQGRTGVFVLAFMTLWFGSIIVAFHNVWSGIPAILTVFGWAQVIKALVYFCFPEYALRRIQFVTPERANLYVVAGVVLLGLAALLGFDLWQRS